MEGREGLRQSRGLKNGEWGLGLQHSFVVRLEYEQLGMNTVEFYDGRFCCRGGNVSDVSAIR